MKDTSINSYIAQEKQDEIFRKMSADRRVEIGSQLWRLAKDLVGDKIHYGRNRSASPSHKDSRDTR